MFSTRLADIEKGMTYESVLIVLNHKYEGAMYLDTYNSPFILIQGP